jgi:hypothetical protein
MMINEVFTNNWSQLNLTFIICDTNHEVRSQRKKNLKKIKMLNSKPIKIIKDKLGKTNWKKNI